eukprot:CAMPEP_0115532280 /NCGR_PEP_ID=MMETSP0271-20121206/85499_1 /TAXON_ID=71861 /ORGANISM="Scrippsiella trochoidea, Strain CCMP3099" /LENGTH=131 /DNA_ID=CAMNT_0002964575 /DNA_START=72 /DNA_END=465 /DNA_ORIENTATION=-
MVQRLSALLSRTNSLRTCSLALQSLSGIAELGPALVQSCVREAAEGLLSAGRCLNSAQLNGKVTTVGSLRDASMLMQAMLPVLAEVKAQLEEPSALPFLASLQPSAVVGAPYVVRSQLSASAGAAAMSSGT